MSLKETLENTIINNVYGDGLGLDYESVQRTAGYIEEEIKEVAIEFADKYVFQILKYYANNEPNTAPQDLFNQFIKERYK